VWNGAPTLAAALESVRAQDYAPLEILVVDDGSTDGSGDVARSVPGVIVLAQKNAGHGAARNAGARATHADFLAFLDADDRWTTHKLSRQMAALEANPESSFALCLMRYRMESPDTWLPRAGHDALDLPAWVPSGLLVRRSAFEALGGFDPAYEIATDSDWFFRAQDAGLKGLVVPEVLLHKGAHGLNQSQRVRDLRGELFRIIRASIDRKRP
jgi:glycosyltransferase involved in cell wall biosynthesis